MSVATLAVRNISHAFGTQVVLSDVSFTLAPTDRIGVVGPNGTGKSTLLRIIAGLQIPEEGTAQLTPPTATIGYLPQEADRRDEPVHAFLARRTGVTAANVALDKASDALASGAENANDLYSAALERYLSLGAADFDVRVGEVLARVGLPSRVTDLPMSVLSGGQAARAGLAALLLSRFDIYLLDEPTNDLDFAGLDQLEEFATTTDAGMLIVSHDREFLSRTINSVLEIDEHSHNAVQYNGTWNEYLDARDIARRHAQEAYSANQTQRAALKSRMQQQREWTEAGVSKAKRSPKDKDKFVRNWAMSTSENQASKMAASQRALDRLEQVDKPWEGWELRLEFLEAPRSGDVVAYLRDAVIRRGDFELGPVSLEVNWQDRLAITGPNGCGKSTLLNALLGRIPLKSGEQFVGPGVVLGEIDQARALLETSQPLVDVFTDYAGILPQETRSLLAKFDLSATHVERLASSLSPGERTRATLALLMARGTNTVVLDEPTNHLDLEAIEQLEKALDQFSGTVILITHDREFLKRVRVTRSFEL